ncbi:hypothetical protein [Metallosphaera hakonensis]|nr:hypothetical protein [Metallosphaera hakonensis]
MGSKGGVGKSTIVYGISRLLSERYIVTIVDLSSSRTICNVYGVRGSLMDGHDYIVDQGNLKIISLYSQLSGNANLAKFKDIYLDLITETDYLILDYGVHLYDKLVSDELIVFYENMSVPTHLIAVSTPQEFIISSTEKMSESYINLVHGIKEDAQVVLEYFVLNMVREKTKFKTLAKPKMGFVEIPFYRDLSFNGFWNANIPKEIVSMANNFEGFLESRG